MAIKDAMPCVKFIFTQGMASLIATGCVPYDEAYCSAMLDDEYTALRKFYDERQA